MKPKPASKRFGFVTGKLAVSDLLIASRVQKAAPEPMTDAQYHS
jgi:hypothetical protein